MLILEGNWGEDNTAEGVVLEKALEKGATKDIDKIMKQEGKQGRASVLADDDEGKDEGKNRASITSV